MGPPAGKIIQRRPDPFPRPPRPGSTHNSPAPQAASAQASSSAQAALFEAGLRRLDSPPFDHSPPVGPGLNPSLFPTHPALGTLCSHDETHVRAAWWSGKQHGFLRLHWKDKIKIMLHFHLTRGSSEMWIDQLSPIARIAGMNTELWADAGLKALRNAMDVYSRGPILQHLDCGVLVKATEDKYALPKYIYGSLHADSRKSRSVNAVNMKNDTPAIAETARLRFCVRPAGKFAEGQKWCFPACLRLRRGWGVNEQNELFVQWWRGLPESVREAGVPVLFSLDIAQARKSENNRVVAMLKGFY